MLIEEISKTQRNAEKRINEVVLIAENIISQKGLKNLALQEIIDKSTMSRGTFFKYFPNKETIIAYLAISGLSFWYELILKTEDYSGFSREKMMIIHATHILCNRLKPIQYMAIFEANNNTNRSAVTDEINSILDGHIAQIISVIEGYLDEARFKENSIGPIEHLTNSDIAFFIWASRYGASVSSINYQINKTEGDLTQKYKLYTYYILDKLDWKPLSTEINYERVLNNILTTYFNKERKEAKKIVVNTSRNTHSIISQEHF